MFDWLLGRDVNAGHDLSVQLAWLVAGFLAALAVMGTTFLVRLGSIPAFLDMELREELFSTRDAVLQIGRQSETEATKRRQLLLEATSVGLMLLSGLDSLASQPVQAIFNPDLLVDHQSRFDAWVARTMQILDPLQAAAFGDATSSAHPHTGDGWPAELRRRVTSGLRILAGIEQPSRGDVQLPERGSEDGVA